MRKQIPVSIGFHSGVSSFDATLEFRDDQAQQDFMNSVVDGTSFMVSVSADRRSGGSPMLREIRFIPELNFAPQEGVHVAASASPNDPYPNLTAYVREQVEIAHRHDHGVIETACEMSLLDEDCRGVLVDRISGAVYLSHDVPFGEIHEYIDEEVEGRSTIRDPRLFLRKDSDD